MKRFLKDDELKNIEGGFSIWGALGIAALVTFIAGIFDGIARPIKCNK